MRINVSAQCYALIAAGFPHWEISEALNTSQPRHKARNYAKRHGLPWPVGRGVRGERKRTIEERINKLMIESARARLTIDNLRSSLNALCQLLTYRAPLTGIGAELVSEVLRSVEAIPGALNEPTQEDYQETASVFREVFETLTDGLNASDLALEVRSDDFWVDLVNGVYSSLNLRAGGRLLTVDLLPNDRAEADNES